jgi:hypothetical protein
MEIKLGDFMKLISFLLAITFYAVLSNAQKASITDLPTDSDTTISIKKGDSSTIFSPDYEVVSGDAAIDGDPDLLTKAARTNWKKACDDWKKEFRELNKENQILAMSCGTSNCVSEKGESFCRSTATYKLKVKIKK